MRMSIGVIQEDFYDVTKDLYARSILGDDPFQLAYDLTIIQCAWMVKEVEKNKKAHAKFGERINRDYISFVRDGHQQYAPLSHARYTSLRDSNPEAAEYMASHSIEDDKKCFVLQAADAVAYEIRRALNIVHKQRTGDIRSQFNLFRNSTRMAIIQTANKQNLLNTVALHKPGEPFKLTDIMENVFHQNIRFEV